MKRLKLTKGKWQGRGENTGGGCKVFTSKDGFNSVATIHVQKNFDILRGQKLKDTEAIDNAKVLINSKANYLALKRIYKEAIKAFEKDSNNEIVDFKLLVGQIADFVNKQIKETEK